MGIGEVVATVVAAAALAMGAAVSPVVSRAPSPAAVPGAADIAVDGWGWPLEPRPQLARGFDPPDRPWLPGHRGVDLRASMGQRVLAPAGGEVTFAGRVAGRAVIVVRHANGLRSTFEPVEGAPARGTSVSAGDPVGLVAATPGHCVPATCVHWGVVRGTDYVDPLSLLGWGPIVLLPLH